MSSLQQVGGKVREISLQVYQDVYNSLTGKTEVLTKMFYEAHHVSLDDIERLHRDFEILLEQYSCAISNCYISVRYCNGKAEGFSGFNRFKLDGVKKSIATEKVEIEYDFLLILPKTEEAKPYKLVVGIRSTLGVVHRMHVTKASEAEKSIFYGLDTGTARFELHYVDLAVARSVEALVEDWYRSLRKRGNELNRKLLETAVASVPTFSRILLLGCAAYLALFLFRDNVETAQGLFSSGVSAATGLMIAAVISLPLANYLRIQLIRSKLHSTVKLGDADQQLIDGSAGNTVKNVGKMLLGLLGGIISSIISVYVVAMIGM